MRLQVEKSSRPSAVAVPRWLTRSASGLGLLVALASPAGATGRKLVSPNQPGRPSPEQPWTEAGGSLPPLPPARSEAPGAPWTEARPGAKLLAPEAPDKAVSVKDVALPVGDKGPGSAHPAIHPKAHSKTRGERITPLFAKAGSLGEDKGTARSEKEMSEREACMARHPAGRDLRAKNVPSVNKYTVKPGDTLWDIAERVLDSNDVRAVARYWPRIHRANRQALGADPNRLAPGLVLLLPAVPATQD